MVVNTGLTVFKICQFIFDKFFIKLLSGEAVNEAVRCPNDILGTYWYYNHTTCSESYWDVCSVASQMTFNYTMCSEKQLFSGKRQKLYFFYYDSYYIVLMAMLSTDVCNRYQNHMFFGPLFLKLCLYFIDTYFAHQMRDVVVFITSHV